MCTFLRKFFSRQAQGTRDDLSYPFGIKVLMVFMTGVLLLLGERAFQDLSDGIPWIEYPLLENIPEVKELRTFEQEEWWPLHERIGVLERSLSQRRGEYDSRLLEKIAREPVSFYGGEEIIRGSITELEADLAQSKRTLTEKEVLYKELSDRARDAEKPVLRAYEWKVKKRQANVFAWEALFWIPFFLLSLFWYSASERKNSAWLIAALPCFIAASILALQSVCVLLWSWIPKELLERLWELLRATLFTRVIGYYLFMALAVLILGGLTILIFRWVMDPARYGKRRIRHGGCPSCSYPLHLSAKFCGGCGKELKKICEHCKKERYGWEERCSECGHD
ncbi:zinc ribbon domain-containing protein [Candidatus Peregrinibacteria bacterium]|nr:zinc ribbon domain-containing protein [Candidatus Peregrinibacteria bacterium]